MHTGVYTEDLQISLINLKMNRPGTSQDDRWTPWQNSSQYRAHPYKDVTFFPRKGSLYAGKHILNATNDAFALNLQSDISARKIEIRWNQYLSRDIKYRIIAECISTASNFKKKECETRWTFDLPWSEKNKVLTTTPGSLYKITVECVSLIDDKVISAEVREVKACMDLKEHEMMYQKAVAYAKLDMHPFYELYRCKPKFYWDYIYAENGGVMEKYIKDENGQPSNQINGKLHGLFFSARLTNGLLPATSPFGDIRMLVPAERLLNPEFHNFYFADFYCNYHTHYVTIVVCRKGSPSDNLCRNTCFPLNIFNNPFLMIQLQYTHRGRPVYQYFVNYIVWVEIYYTENILLNEGRFHNIIATGAGTSKIGGLPNNKNCTICNLYPVTTTASNVKAPTEIPDSLSIDLTIDESQQQNSTFISLCHLDKTGLEKIFNDIVEVICGIVDGVCEMQQEEDGIPIETISDDVIIQSNREIMKLIKNTSKELSANPIFKVCPKITELWESVKRHADSFQKKIANVQEDIKSRTSNMSSAKDAPSYPSTS